MVTVPAYIASRFLRRFVGFFEHWYMGGTRFFWVRTKEVLGNFDKTFAVLVTARHIFEPLYQDRTFIGYVLGFIFRVSRILIGISIYVVVFVAALALYILWVVTPAYFAYKFFEGLTL